MVYNIAISFRLGNMQAEIDFWWQMRVFDFVIVFVVLCGTLWYFVVFCGTVWYCVVRCGTFWYFVTLCGTLLMCFSARCWSSGSSITVYIPTLGNFNVCAFSDMQHKLYSKILIDKCVQYILWDPQSPLFLPSVYLRIASTLQNCNSTSCLSYSIPVKYCNNVKDIYIF